MLKFFIGLLSYVVTKKDFLVICLKFDIINFVDYLKIEIMEHLKALKYFLKQINTAAKEGLKLVNHPQKLLIIMHHLSEIVNHENLKRIVKEAEQERKGLEWIEEKKAATKLLNKYKLYKGVAYEAEIFGHLIDRLKRWDVRETFGDSEIITDITGNYKIFKNNFKESEGYGTASKAVKVLAKYYSELNEVAKQVQAQRYDRDKIAILNIWKLDQLP